MNYVVICLLVLTLFYPGRSLGKETSEQQIHHLVQRVESRYTSLRDFQADFIQETRIEGFETPIQSSGHVYIKKPGYLRWDYLKPSVEQIYVHGDQFQMYVPQHHQILKGNLTSMVATKAPLQLLQGVGKLTEYFEVRPVEGGKKGEGGLPLLSLLPKDQSRSASASVMGIVVEIQPETYLIRSITLQEISGNISTFRFSNVKTNEGLDDTVFTLNPPEGVVIVEDVLPQG